MSIQFLNFSGANGFTIRDDEFAFLFKLAKMFQNTYPNKRICFIRETWLGQEQFENLIKNVNYDLLVLFCLMDQHMINTSNIKNCIEVGYVKNSEFFYDSLSVFFAKRFEYNFEINTDPKKFTKHFLSYNGKPHWHRIQLIKELKNADLLNYGHVTFASKEKRTNKIIFDIPQENKIVPGPYDPLTLGPEENWNTSFLNIVTETEVDPSAFWFWNEKTFKPILGYRPFLTYAHGGNVEMLRHYKFEDYTNDFKDISDLDLTVISNIVPFLEILCQQDMKYIRYKYKRLWSKIEYNRENFFNHARNQADIFRKFKKLSI